MATDVYVNSKFVGSVDDGLEFSRKIVEERRRANISSNLNISFNEDLNEDPGLINRSPYEKGWIARIKIADSEEQSNLMTAEEYSKFLESVG